MNDKITEESENFIVQQHISLQFNSNMLTTQTYSNYNFV